MKRFLKIFNRLFYSLIFILLMAPYTHAETNSDTINTYKEFFESTGAKDQYEQMLSLMINQFRKGFSSGLIKTIKNNSNLSDEQKKHLTSLIRNALNNYLTRMHIEIKKIMPFDKLATNIYIPIYSKHFKNEEIKAITSFFKSEIGRKYISEAPVLMQESVTMINKKITPQLHKVSLKISNQEFRQLRKELSKLKKK